MATKSKGKKSKAGKAQKANARSKAAKAKRAAAKGTGNPALDRANREAGKKIAGGIDKAAGAALAKLTGKKGPQFFGRPKVKKAVDPEKQNELRRKEHAKLMQVPEFAEYRKKSIALWVQRRKLIAANAPQSEIEAINVKLEKLAKKRKAALGKPAAKPEKIAKAKKAKKEKAPTDTIGDALAEETKARLNESEDAPIVEGGDVAAAE